MTKLEELHNKVKNHPSRMCGEFTDKEFILLSYELCDEFYKQYNKLHGHDGNLCHDFSATIFILNGEWIKDQPKDKIIEQIIHYEKCLVCIHLFITTKEKLERIPLRGGNWAVLDKNLGIYKTEYKKEYVNPRTKSN